MHYEMKIDKELAVRLSLVAVIAMTFAVLTVAPSMAAIVLRDDFNPPNQPVNLVGTTPDVSTGNWSQTGTITTTPIQVTGNKAAIGNSGQDVYAAFSSGIAHSDGNSIFSGFTINVSAANAAGDYFFHLSDPVGTTTLF